MLMCYFSAWVSWCVQTFSKGSIKGLWTPRGHSIPYYTVDSASIVPISYSYVCLADPLDKFKRTRPPLPLSLSLPLASILSVCECVFSRSASTLELGSISCIGIEKISKVGNAHWQTGLPQHRSIVPRFATSLTTPLESGENVLSSLKTSTILKLRGLFVWDK